MKKNIILIRGLVRERGHWYKFPATLEAQGFTVHYIDFPGAGDFFRERSCWMVGDAVEKMRPVYLQMKAKMEGNCLLCGLSLGGMMAIEWGARYPQDFSQLIVINSSAANLSSPWGRLLLPGLGYIVRIMLAGDRWHKERLMLDMTSNITSEEERREIAQEWQKIAMARPVSLVNGLIQLFSALIWRAPKRDVIKVPMLILQSARDQMVSSACSTRLAQHFRYMAQIQTHPTAGHDLTLDDPLWAAEKIGIFFKE